MFTVLDLALTNHQIIIAKLEYFKHEELIKSKGKELKGTKYGLNDQFPCKNNEKIKIHKVLCPIMKQHRQSNKRTS